MTCPRCHPEELRLPEGGPSDAGGRERRIFLIGNPNSGKTSLFNALTGERRHVGNWPGITVERLEGRLGGTANHLILTDLPGTYSLSPLTPEEGIVLKVLDDAREGILVNVIDAANLERNLFLTMQLLELGFRPLLVLNCMDAVQSSGARLDLEKFGALMGCRVFPTVARTGEGVDRLRATLAAPEVDTFPAEPGPSPTLDEAWQAALAQLLDRQGPGPEANSPSPGPKRRLQAIGELLDVRNPASGPEVGAIRERLVTALGPGDQPGERPLGVGDLPCRLATDRYRRIARVLEGCFQPATAGGDRLSDSLDTVLAHRFWGLPVFFLMMAGVFWSTFSLGKIPAGWISEGLAWGQEAVRAAMVPGLLRDLLTDGVLSGVGGVLVFLPNVVILFFWLALLEDSGYLARAAYLVDYFMQKMGLHGKAFIPLLMGFGCNVPAVMATRIIEHPRQRQLAMLLLPLVSCSARLPIMVLLCGAFFPEYPGTMLFLVYALNFLIIFLLGHLASRLIPKGPGGSFLLEMPSYRVPTWRSLRVMLMEKVMHFLEKAGSVILMGSILIWFLTAFPREVPLTQDYDGQIARLAAAAPSEAVTAERESLEQARDREILAGRWMARLGRGLLPFVEPLGFGWREAVSLIPGFLAKESIISTMAVLYAPVDQDLGKAMHKEGMTPLSAFVFMLFTLLYVPCLPTIGVIFRESGSWRFTTLAFVLPAVLAWCVGFAVHMAGGRLGAWVSRFDTPGVDVVIVLILVIVSAIMLVRRGASEVAGNKCAGCPSQGSCQPNAIRPGGSCEES